MPLRTSFLRTRFSAKEADWPAEQRGTGMRLRSMERMLVVRNWPRESGPTRMASPEWMTPWSLLGAEVGGGSGKAGLTALYDARDDGPDERYGEGVVDVEFKGGFVVVVAVMGQDVEEGSDEVEAFAGDVGDLEYGAYPLAHELGGSLDGFVAVLDEDGDFPGAR